jgi:hypothetical protein
MPVEVSAPVIEAVNVNNPLLAGSQAHSRDPNVNQGLDITIAQTWIRYIIQNQDDIARRLGGTLKGLIQSPLILVSKRFFYITELGSVP